VKYIIATTLLFLGINVAQAMPRCSFFTQNEITSSYKTLTPNTLKDIYFLNLELDASRKGNHFRTVVFDKNCNILYKRDIDTIPDAIFSLDETSNIVFITKFSGNSYAVDAYLVEEINVTPVILDLHSISYPIFDNLKDQTFPNIISCTDACNIYKFDKNIKHYIKSRSISNNESCLPAWMTPYKPAWMLSNEKEKVKQEKRD